MSTAVIVQLGIVIQQINRYAPIFLLLFGFLANLLNCFIFTRRNLRSNPCSVYFLAASLMNLIGVVTGFTPRIINGWNIKLDLTETISALCPLFLFVLFSTRSIAAWMIAFAAIDRYFVSSRDIHRRQMSNLENTYGCILFSLLFVMMQI
jgi:hypothetical protein